MDFLKVQGTLNDFVLIDEMDKGLSLTNKEREFWAISLCDRETGIGADGVLFVLPSINADAQMRIFNADGSEALMCGNGLRCFGRYIIEKLGVEKVTIQTAKANYTVTFVPDFSKELSGYKIDLDNVQFFGQTEKTLDFQKSTKTPLVFEHLTVSNPHVVAFCDRDQMADENLVPLGTVANTDKNIFETGMNVNLVQVLDDLKIYVRTYERGVGITKSCGTGMTSSVTAYALKESHMNEWIDVYNDGGKIVCRVKEGTKGYSVEFIGNATYVFRGVILSQVQEPVAFQVDALFGAETARFESFFQNTRLEIGL